MKLKKRIFRQQIVDYCLAKQINYNCRVKFRTLTPVDEFKTTRSRVGHVPTMYSVTSPLSTLSRRP